MKIIKKAFVVITLTGLGNAIDMLAAMELCIPDSPLHHATRQKNAVLVAALLQIDSDPNIVDEYGHAPFYYACMDPLSENPEECAAQYKIIQLLYCAGGDDPSITYAKLEDKPSVLKAIFYADRYLTVQAAEESHDIACALSPHPLKARMGKFIEYPDKKLFYAAMRGNMSAIIGALYVGADISAEEAEHSTHHTALHTAAIYNQQEMLQFLLDCRANINAKNREGNTPLHEAAIKNRLEIVRLLLEHNANSNAQNAEGSTPLHIATTYPGKTPESVKLLLDHRANGNIQDNAGDTPLHTAACWKHAESVRLLLAAGVNKNIRNRNGLTAANIADYGHCPEILAQLNGEPPCVVS